MLKSRWNWRTMAFFGRTRMSIIISTVSASSVERIGSRPTNSGISPYCSRSSGETWLRIAARSCSDCGSPAVKPSARRPRPVRLPITFSSPSKAPPTMNSTFAVLIWMKSWCGCLRPPCGGTEATVPSMIFSSACCTPSPETSRVIEGLSDLRAILSISSM